MSDFTVQQTYAEIERLIEESAESILTDCDFDGEWSRRIGRLIAERTTMQLDAAEDI